MKCNAHDKSLDIPTPKPTISAMYKNYTLLVNIKHKLLESSGLSCSEHFRVYIVMASTSLAWIQVP